MKLIEIFALLQFLDFLTTLVGLRLGGQEANAFVRWLIEMGPLTGLAVCKAGAFALGGLFVYLKRHTVLEKINYIFAGVVTWNLVNILILVNRLPN